MARNLRNHIVIHNNVSTESASVSGSGPLYVVSYDDTDSPDSAKVGHHVYIEKRAAGDSGGTVLSTYVYVVTVVVTEEESGAELTMKYLYDTAGTGDDSPLDLPSGEGSSGSPEPATHDIVMILGPAFEAFVD